MIKDILNELNIRCLYIDRGCQEILQLQHLDQHEDTCGFTPAVCTNQGCGATVNQRDLIHHESEVCQFRKLKCHSCKEATKTLVDIQKRMANMEKNAVTKMAALNTEKNIQTNVANIEKRIENMETKVVAMETKLTNVEKNMADIKTDIEGKIKTVDDKVTGLKTALIEGFNELKDVLLEIKQENTKIVRNTPSGDRENIIVAGGWGDDSVEMFNWREKTWSPLQSMPQKRSGATSFVYNNHVTIAGGWCHPGYLDDMIRMTAVAKPDLSTHWSDCPVKLPTKLARTAVSCIMTSYWLQEVMVKI